MATKYDEQRDLDLLSSWLDGRGLTTQRFSRAETLAGKTPDFKVLKGNDLVAYCEVKSPNDPWLDGLLENAPPFTIVGGGRPDPTFNRIARLMNNADQQFAAVNPNREAFNILAYVNHDEHSDFNDLREVLTGYLHAESGERFPTMLHIAEGVVGASKSRIDAFVWFDGSSRKLRGIVFNETDVARRDRVCRLLGVDPAQIKR